jgi:tetratricopeptide (TPR) repeat protein
LEKARDIAYSVRNLDSHLMKLSNFQRILLVIGLVGVLLAVMLFLGRNVIRDTIREVRAERLFEKAQAAFEEERWDIATRQGQAAHYLTPENEAIMLLVARSTLNERSRSTLDWWKMVLGNPDLPIEDLKLLTSILLRSGNTDDALLFLNELAAMDPEDPQIQQLWLQLLDLQKRYGQAREFASRIVQGGSEDWGVHQFYMNLESQLTGTQGEEETIRHLKELITDEGPLAINAARRLAIFPTAGSAERLMAAEYLVQNASDQLDLLLARSVEVKEGVSPESVLDPLLQELLDDPEAGQLMELLNWSRYMGMPEWFLSNIPFTDFVEKGGTPAAYLRLMFDDERYQELVTLTEGYLADAEAGMSPILMYYRASALERLGEAEDSAQVMALALQVVDPENASSMEQALIRDNRWPLLVDLYEAILEEAGSNSLVQFKLVAAAYYVGDQEKVLEVLEGIEAGEYDQQPGQASFIYYLRIILEGPTPETHSTVESLLTAYPQVSDFRPVLGLSYLLQDNEEAARQFSEGIPEIDPAMPRFVRIAGILLGRDQEEYLLPGEFEYILPRERYLISRYAVESNR